MYSPILYVQISDIHLSVVNDFEVREDLRTFCTETISTVSPVLVLVTGQCACGERGDMHMSMLLR